jgi:N-acetylmuramoyl-L-alanine amidase
MRISNHKLDGVEFKLLGDRPRVRPPRYIVVHFTAGGSVAGSFTHLKQERLSYHVLVGRTGEPLQCVRFDHRAAHAGVSNWKGHEGLNDLSIGIAAANFGQLTPRPNERFFNTNGHMDPITPIFKRDEVVVSAHRNGGKVFGWERFPAPQLATIREICQVLVETFPTIVDIIGHDDVAVGRKVDPGPAFPMEALHDLVPNRVADPGPRFRVNTPGDTLTLRAAFKAEAKPLAQLEHSRTLRLRSVPYTFKGSEAVLTDWASVDVAGDLAHHRFVRRKFLVADDD